MTATLPKKNRALDRLLGQAQAEDDAATAERRRELGATLQEIDARVEREKADIAPKLALARKRLADIQSEMTQAISKANSGVKALERILYRTSEVAGRDRQAVIRELEATCPPEVDALIDQLEKTLASMNIEGFREKRDTDKEHRFGGKIMAIFSNRPSIDKKIDRLIAARIAAWSLRSRYVADLAAELQGIRDTLGPDDFPVELVVELIA
jgi:hypothetical protein